MMNAMAIPDKNTRAAENPHRNGGTVGSIFPRGMAYSRHGVSCCQKVRGARALATSASRALHFSTMEMVSRVRPLARSNWPVCRIPNSCQSTLGPSGSGMGALGTPALHASGTFSAQLNAARVVLGAVVHAHASNSKSAALLILNVV